MRILLVSSDNYSGSGAFLSMAKLAQLLKDHYEADIMVVLPYEGSGTQLLVDYGVPFLYVHSYDWICHINHDIRTKARNLKKAVKNCGAIHQITRIIDDFRPDIVHINTSWTYVGAVAAAFRCVPTIWHIREFLEEDQDRQIWNRRLGYWVMNHSSRIVAISNGIRNKYDPLLREGIIRLIYNGIDEKLFYNPEKIVFMNKDVKFVCVGGLNSGKGQETIIKACGELKKRGFKNFELYIVGEGNELNNLKRQTKALNLINEVHFEGFQKDTQKYYQMADIAIVSSKNEAFGRVTVEAMLSGTLVIGTRSGGTPEVLNNGRVGYLYEPGNVEELTDIILTAVNNVEESRNVAKAGREYALNHFTAERNAKEIYELYNEVLAERSRAQT